MRRDRAFEKRVPSSGIAEIDRFGQDFNALLAELQGWHAGLTSENAELARRAHNLPAGELLLRFAEFVSSPGTLVVVTCAWLARAIIGATRWDMSVWATPGASAGRAPPQPRVSAMGTRRNWAASVAGVSRRSMATRRRWPTPWPTATST